MWDIPVDWNVFEYKFSSNPRLAFENLSYILFCHEYHIRNGVFRYLNQPYIETQPVETNDGYLTGFQAKYYDASTSLSSRKRELINSIIKAKKKYKNLNRFIIYTNKELSASSDLGRIKPQYQIEIEDCGNRLGIKVEWRVKSNFEIMLVCPELDLVRNLFFNPNPALQKYIERIIKRSSVLIDTIDSDIVFSEKRIKIDLGRDQLLNFWTSDFDVFIVCGKAGVGKSGFVKDFIIESNTCRQEQNILVFSASDFDVEDERQLFFSEEYQIDDLLSLVQNSEEKLCVIDSVEKYCTFKNPEVLKSIVQKLIAHKWKLVFTIRENYVEGFCDTILDSVPIKRFDLRMISYEKLSALAREYGFVLPDDKRFCDLLCNLFYLKLYLGIAPSETVMPSSTELFVNLIWKKVFRNEQTSRDNLPSRREKFITDLVLELLNKESYVYTAKATDDYGIISCFEDSGVIVPYDDSGDSWVFSHDVYEEIAFNHILSKRLNESDDLYTFIEEIDNSFRSRKLYRTWLETKLSEPDSRLEVFLTKMLQSRDVARSWKDETIIALMNASNDASFQIIYSILSDNEYELFTRAVFLLNTACRSLNVESIKLFKSQKINLNKYRFSVPCGKAWYAIFSYIHRNQTLIPWSINNLNFVLEAMHSWVSKNTVGETTRLIGRVALFLRNKAWGETTYKHSLSYDENYSKICKVILQSALEIKDELSEIYEEMIRKNSSDKKIIDDTIIDKSLSNIYECGLACAAIPDKWWLIAKEFWLLSEDNSYDRLAKTERDFGLNENLSFDYYPSSAYQTPFLVLLNKYPQKGISFVLDLMNYSAECFKESYLNKDYNECQNIIIVFSNEETREQICSDRLWKMHRGTSVAPTLLESVLMALEKFMLAYIKLVPEEEAIRVCLDMLRRSNNVTITSLIVSLVIAYPEKLFEISCILLKTKEVFQFDTSRYVSESTCNFFSGAHGVSRKLFDDERIESNKLDFRKKRFEDVILNYQIGSDSLSKPEKIERIEKLYISIDKATENIDTWEPSFKAPYYRMDLRRYVQKGDSVTKNGNTYTPFLPDYPEEIVALSKKNNDSTKLRLDIIELGLWALLRYKNDKKYKDYKRYETNPLLAFDEMKAMVETGDETSENYDISAIVLTAAVFLRDFCNQIDCEKKDYCSQIIIKHGFHLLKSHSLIYRPDINKAIVNEIARLVSLDTLDLDWNNPLLLLLAFLMDYHRQSFSELINPLSDLWKMNGEAAKRLFQSFVNLFPLMKNTDIVSFVDSHLKEIKTLLSQQASSLESTDVRGLDYNSKLFLGSLLDNSDSTLLPFVLKNGDQIWKVLFSNDRKSEKYERNYRLEIKYKKWLAEFVLNLSDYDQIRLVQKMLPLVEFDQSFAEWLSDIIIAENENPRYEAFWDLWVSMQEFIFSAFSSKEEFYRDPTKPTGYSPFEKVLENYLLAFPYWDEQIEEWHSLKQKNAALYWTVLQRVGFNPTTLFSIAKVLNSVGKKVFIDKGIYWLSSIIENNTHLKEKPLPINTEYYIEEYIYSYIRMNHYDFRTNIEAKKKILIVLDFLVSRGSTVGFFLRDEIL